MVLPQSTPTYLHNTLSSPPCLSSNTVTKPLLVSALTTMLLETRPIPTPPTTPANRVLATLPTQTTPTPTTTPLSPSSFPELDLSVLFVVEYLPILLHERQWMECEACLCFS
ncbi:hypothetical protein SERLA73DRAFT_178599 [Serpula lacrymans var. lacrymans S7.3]|uniref:Uncharacterized protein n=2 Tax=Serpula lacrymans var. lacrymans TaxID=341189 RepID=F8PS92_SERL3|nr:uncharacterized protein SERLADRAFT_463102 [Serpula lacrymans var. lacrymans S7.9]EGO00705.1 hypothetical protein SERLA73DRAFT_178599 [Serpula lacrymans var. lacrymans S7.3]EGO26252.1 hypothetical protein SERLADRAFT_463102 [Serpula lacrymans var. lacrymans S7.9]